MNEAERTAAQILVSAALDFISHVENGWDVDRDESETLREAIRSLLRHIYDD